MPFKTCHNTEEEEDEEEEEEPLLIYTAQGSPFRCKKLSVINGSPEHNDVLKLWNTYAYSLILIVFAGSAGSAGSTGSTGSTGSAGSTGSTGSTGSSGSGGFAICWFVV